MGADSPFSSRICKPSMNHAHEVLHPEHYDYAPVKLFVVASIFMNNSEACKISIDTGQGLGLAQYRHDSIDTR